MEPGRSDPTDSSQETLRAALFQAKKLLSAKKILNLIIGPNSKGKPEYSDRSLLNFIGGKTNTLSQANFDLLSAWLDTPLSRALRTLGTDSLSAFDQLVRVLADGTRGKPEGVCAAGNYFMYHGSYIRPRHYVVRALTVSAEDDHILTVTDTIRDDITLGTRTRASSGVMVFPEGLPQILLYGEENKRGLSLIIASRADDRDGALDQVFGAFVVRPARGDTATRHCLMIRETGLQPEAMIAETGIYSEKEIADPARDRHRHAFERLKKLATAEAFDDPIITYGNNGIAALPSSGVGNAALKG